LGAKYTNTTNEHIKNHVCNIFKKLKSNRIIGKMNPRETKAKKVLNEEEQEGRFLPNKPPIPSMIRRIPWAMLSTRVFPISVQSEDNRFTNSPVFFISKKAIS
jgi:hypothetical protein